MTETGTDLFNISQSEIQTDLDAVVTGNAITAAGATDSVSANTQEMYTWLETIAGLGAANGDQVRRLQYQLTTNY